jgi:hypothetical protein
VPAALADSLEQLAADSSQSALATIDARRHTGEEFTAKLIEGSSVTSAGRAGRYF